MSKPKFYIPTYLHISFIDILLLPNYYIYKFKLNLISMCNDDNYKNTSGYIQYRRNVIPNVILLFTYTLKSHYFFNS